MLTPSVPLAFTNATAWIDSSRERVCEKVWWVSVPVGDCHVVLEIASGLELRVKAHLHWMDASARGISKIECIYCPEAAAIFEVFLETVCQGQRIVDFQNKKCVLGFFAEMKVSLTPSRPWSIRKHVIEVAKRQRDLCAQLDLVHYTQALPNDNLFGPPDWRKFLGLNVEDCPPPAHFYRICKERSSAFSEESVGKTHLCVFIPEGITLEMVESLTLNPKEGYPCGLRNKHKEFTAAFLSQYGQIPSERAAWFLIPQKMISRRGSKIEKEYQSKGYEPLSATTGLIALLLACVKTGQKHYSNAPWSYAKCKEQVIRGAIKQSAAIGGFNSDGLDVTYAYGRGFESQGVGVQRALSVFA